MDSGTAVVYGAAIALVGSAVIPWIREEVQQRGQRRREYDRELRAATRDAMQGLNEMFYVYGTPIKAKNAIHQQVQRLWLAMVVRRQDRPISHLIDRVASNLVEPDEYVRLASIKALADVLPQWFRRECKTSEVVRLYEREYESWLKFHREDDEDKMTEVAAPEL
jgi:hypothetical protein